MLPAFDNVTFSNVTVPSSGTYQLEIDYQTSGVRSYFVSINDGAATELDLKGSSFNDPAVTILPVQLNAGVNTIQIGNSTGFAPDLDRIVVAPPVRAVQLRAGDSYQLLAMPALCGHRLFVCALGGYAFV